MKPFEPLHLELNFLWYFCTPAHRFFTSDQVTKLLFTSYCCYSATSTFSLQQSLSLLLFASMFSPKPSFNHSFCHFLSIFFSKFSFYIQFHYQTNISTSVPINLDLFVFLVDLFRTPEFLTRFEHSNCNLRQFLPHMFQVHREASANSERIGCKKEIRQQNRGMT